MRPNTRGEEKEVEEDPPFALPRCYSHYLLYTLHFVQHETGKDDDDSGVWVDDDDDADDDDDDTIDESIGNTLHSSEISYILIHLPHKS